MKQQLLLLLKIEILAEWDNLLIKEILLDHLSFSRKSLARIKNDGDIQLNGISYYVTMRVEKGNILEIYVPKEMSEDIMPQCIPLDIFYEDADIMVINKPANIVIHPTRNHYLGTIANGLMYYWQAKGEKYRFRPVNRLDKDTSGLFIVAKNQHAHHKLALQLNNKQLQRKYHAIVHGSLMEKSGFIDAPILKDPNHGIKRIIDFNNVEAKSALTYFEVLKTNNNYSLIELKLVTGRTHQIRVHLSWLGHPLVGDDLYGGGLDTSIKRQALHAKNIEFIHPLTGELLKFNAEYPSDMEIFINNLFTFVK